MSASDRIKWDQQHQGKTTPGDPEPFLLEMLPLLKRDGLVLDVAAGRGRNALPMAQARMHVIAVDVSEVALRFLARLARDRQLAIAPVLADLDNFAFRTGSFDAVINLNFLDRELFPHLLGALKPGGILVAETFLTDQAEIGHPRDPRFLLRHYELRAMLADLELLRYREGLVVYADGTRAWRAGAVARRRS